MHPLRLQLRVIVIVSQATESAIKAAETTKATTNVRLLTSTKSAGSRRLG
jgi:hypothetical protein